MYLQIKPLVKFEGTKKRIEHTDLRYQFAFPLSGGFKNSEPKRLIFIPCLYRWVSCSRFGILNKKVRLTPPRNSRFPYIKVSEIYLFPFGQFHYNTIGRQVQTQNITDYYHLNCVNYGILYELNRGGL